MTDYYYQHPYVAQNALAHTDYSSAYDHQLSQVYGGHSSYPCKSKQQHNYNLPCGGNGIVAGCSSPSILDTWITGYQNSIYALGKPGGSGCIWPSLQQSANFNRCKSQMVWTPRLQNCCQGQLDKMSFSDAGLFGAKGSIGNSIYEAYGFPAQKAAQQGYGLGNYHKMQKGSPPRYLQEPGCGSFLR
jgi:hypothetical protein